MMLGKIPLAMISVLIVMLILGIVFALLLFKNKKKRCIDYYVFFILGIIYVPVGIVVGNYVLSLVGFVLAIIGIIHKDKWKQDRKSFNQVDKSEKRIFLWIIIVLGIFVLVGLISFFIYNCNESKLDNGERDEYGCLISEGYVYCPSTAKCQVMSEEYCDEYKDEFVIDSFESCALAGNPVMESYPRRCSFGGKSFVEEL